MKRFSAISRSKRLLPCAHLLGAVTRAEAGRIRLTSAVDAVDTFRQCLIYMKCRPEGFLNPVFMGESFELILVLSPAVLGDGGGGACGTTLIGFSGWSEPKRGHTIDWMQTQRATALRGLGREECRLRSMC